jgi:hypothetical protein
MKMNGQIKPCPLCGNTAELKESHYLESEKPYSYVHCTNQQCTLHHHNNVHFSGEGEEENSKKAIAAWNERSMMPA